MEQVDDETLTRALAADLDGTFEALVRAYQDRLYAFGLRLTGSPRDAEEIAQDAFVRAYRALARYPAERVETLKLRAWLFQVTVNVARNRGGHRSRPRCRYSRRTVPTTAWPTGRTTPPSSQSRSPSATTSRIGWRPWWRPAGAVSGRRGAPAHPGIELSGDRGGAGQPTGTVKSNVHRGVAYLRAALDAAGVSIGTADLAAGRA